MDAKIDDRGAGASGTWRFSLLALVLASACSGREAPRAPEPSRQAPRAPVHDGPCRAGPERLLMTLDAVPEVLGAALVGDHGLVIVPAADGASLVRVPVLDDGRPASIAPHAAPFPSARGLRVVAATGREIVVVTEGPCAGSGARCLAAGRFDLAGAPVGQPVVASGHAPISRLRRQTGDAFLLLAFSTPHGAPWVDAFMHAPGGLTHARTTLSSPPEGKDDDVLALTGDPSGFAVLHRVGSPEDPAGALLLSTPDRVATVRALEEAAGIDHFARAGDGYDVVAAFEFDRPIALRLDARGEPSGEPRRLPPGAQVEGAGTMGRLADDGSHLEVVLTSAIGDPIDRVRIASRADATRRAASIARSAHGFLVAYVDARDAGTRTRSARLVARAVTCGARGR